MRKFLGPNKVGKDTLKGYALHLLADGSAVYRPTAADVTAGSIALKLTDAPAVVLVEVYSDYKTKKAWDGAYTLSGKTLTINNAGAVDWAAGDRIVIRASYD